MKGCQPLSFDEFDLVLNTFSGPFQHRDRLLFVLGATTGFRISELLSLTVDSVWSRGHPNKIVGVRRNRMKGKHESRSVPLPEVVHTFLRSWIAELSLRNALAPDLPLFLSRKATYSICSPASSFFSRLSRPLTHIYIRARKSPAAGADRPHGPHPQAAPRAISRVQAHRVISAALVAAVGQRPCNGTHTMRKTFASRVFAASGQNIFILQQALAHRSPASTVAYLDGCSNQVAAAIAAAALPPVEKLNPKT